MSLTRSDISLVLADDHAVVRKGIREFLEADERLHVVAEAADGDQAYLLTTQHKPDVAVLDIQMPGKTGIEVTRLLRQSGAARGILILTAYDDEPFVKSALLAGANGYVLKTAEPEELVRAVFDVHEGQTVLDKRISWSQLGRSMTRADVEAALLGTDERSELSPREIEVLQLAAQGFTNKAIAAQLGISDRTVQGHLASIFQKLGAQSRTDAVMAGLRLGLVSLS